MILPTEKQAHAFIRPFRNRLTTFIIDSRQTSLSLARFLLGCMSMTKISTRIIDIDAFYASGVMEIAPVTDEMLMENLIISLPAIDDSIDDWLIDQLTLEGRTNALIMDNLNSLYHLLALKEERYANRKLVFLAALMSHIARSKHQSILCMAYDRNRVIQEKINPLGIGNLGDLAVAVRNRKSTLMFDSHERSFWNEGKFAVRIS